MRNSVLTCPLPQRRRNDLIVVASLIDRLPNLAGLCRTCEIFNAGLLTVHNLKVSIRITRRNGVAAMQKI
jgi:hypothetical protein